MSIYLAYTGTDQAFSVWNYLFLLDRRPSSELKHSNPRNLKLKGTRIDAKEVFNKTPIMIMHYSKQTGQNN